MLSTLLDPTGAAVVAKAVTNFNSYIDDFYPKQIQLRGFLSLGSVLTDAIAAWEAFHGELYHLTKVCSGAALVYNATMLIGKWSDASKLGPGTLSGMKQVALDLYSITIP